MDHHLFDRWLHTAEKKAGSRSVGGLRRPYRRKWATERKYLPITDVAAAGGSQDTATLLTCYQQPTNDALLAVMSEEAKGPRYRCHRGELARKGPRNGPRFATTFVTRCIAIGTAGFEPATP
jgi:hypothetical protein